MNNFIREIGLLSSLREPGAFRTDFAFDEEYANGKLSSLQGMQI